jgi:hypothetical protein
MEELFWLIRLPVTMVLAVLLAAALPLWFVLGLVGGLLLFLAGGAAIPVVMVNHAWRGDADAFRRYLRGLVDVETYINGWWKPYSRRWSNLAKWQETGR